jgi:hypothetical protein
VIDTTSEQLYPLAAACAWVPPSRGGRRTHVSTLMRWLLKGCRGPSGELVRLEACRVVSRWMVSRQAFQRFCERLTPPFDSPAPSGARTPTGRRRASERAAAELDRLGI